MLSADDIRRAAEAAPPVSVVACPALGGDVCVRGLTCKELDRFQAVKFDAKGRIVQQPNPRGRLLALCLCDERGKRLFGDDDEGFLGDLPAASVATAYDKARALSGISDDGVEEQEKN